MSGLPTATLVMHLDAQAISGIPDGDFLPTWADVSGNDNDARIDNSSASLNGQGTPRYSASAINGFPAIFFNGASFYSVANSALPGSSTSPWAAYNAYTVCIVMKGNYNAILGFPANPSQKWDSCGFVMGAAQFTNTNVNTTNRWCVCPGNLYHGSVQNGFFASAEGGGYGQADGVIMFTVSATNGNPAVVRMWTNGCEHNNVFSSANTQANSGNLLNIGCWSSTNNNGGTTFGFMNGWIGEILFYNSVLSTADAEQLHQAIAAKWGITRNWGLGFNPAQYPNANSATNQFKLVTYLDMAVSIPPSMRIDGADVVGLIDLGGYTAGHYWNSGYWSFLQNNGAPSAPKYKSNVLNGLPGLDFPAGLKSAISFSCAGSNSQPIFDWTGQGATIILVFKPLDTNGFLSDINQLAGTIAGFYVAPGVVANGNPVVSVSTAPEASPPTGQWSVWAVRIGSSIDVSSALNDGPFVAAQPTAGFLNRAGGGGSIVMGRNVFSESSFGNGSYWHGTVASVLYYREALPTTQIRNIMNQLGFRYGFTWGIPYQGLGASNAF